MNSKNINNVVDLPDGRLTVTDNFFKKKQSLPVHLAVLVICSEVNMQVTLTSQFNLISNLNVEFSEKIPEQFSQFELVILAINKDNDTCQQVIEKLALEHMPTLLLGDGIAADIIRTAMHHHVLDIIPFDDIEQELFNTLTLSANNILKTKKVAPVISIINGKSGSGASFITACLGEISANLCPDEIVLIDADLHYGSLADSLNLKANYFLTDALNEIDKLDNMAIKSMMTKRNNLSLLASKAYAQLDQEQNKNFKHLEQLIWKIKLNHDLILVDLSRGLDMLTLPLVSLSSQFLIVVQQNIVSLREAKALIQQLTERMGVSKNMIQIIVNRHSKKVTHISLNDIKKALLIDSVFYVSNNYQLASSCTDLGSPLAKLTENKIIHKEICTIIRNAFPIKFPKEKPNFFSKIFGGA
ncbi:MULTISPECIES: AAA family ATPase [Colwellia]|uniref:Flp pilus assembly protein n=1 Tax=Colwellia marinimaniae TaxID=1513592 RepID=A0ABQ0MR85_9GAMM|nr:MULTISPECIES: AAA family ATPase [Colwellia]GAW94874.1 Flp pilus assembly protein [Colwellia marinimaniae]